MSYPCYSCRDDTEINPHVGNGKFCKTANTLRTHVRKCHPGYRYETVSMRYAYFMRNYYDRDVIDFEDGCHAKREFLFGEYCKAMDLLPPNQDEYKLGDAAGRWKPTEEQLRDADLADRKAMSTSLCNEHEPDFIFHPVGAGAGGPRPAEPVPTPAPRDTHTHIPVPAPQTPPAPQPAPAPQGPNSAHQRPIQAATKSAFDVQVKTTDGVKSISFDISDSDDSEHIFTLNGFEFKVRKRLSQPEGGQTSGVVRKTELKSEQANKRRRV